MDGREQRLRELAQAAVQAAARREWAVLAEAILDLDCTGLLPAALLVLARSAALGQPGWPGVEPWAHRLPAGFDQARLPEWCAAAGLPDLTGVLRARSGGNASAASPLFSGAVSAADMSQACYLAVSAAKGDAVACRFIIDVPAAPGDPGRLARLAAAVAIAAAASPVGLEGLPGGGAGDGVAGGGAGPAVEEPAAQPEGEWSAAEAGAAVAAVLEQLGPGPWSVPDFPGQS